MAIPLRQQWVCRIILLLCPLLWGFRPAAWGAPAWHVRSWSASTGLPDNVVRSLAQTADGRLWILTDGNLVSFNGQTFQPLPEEVRKRLALAGMERILASSDGGLWIATRQAGVLKWRANELNSVAPTGSAPSGSSVTALCEDGLGNVWIGRRGIIERHHRGGVDLIRVPSQGQTQPSVSLLVAPPGDRVWVVCGNYAGWCGGELGYRAVNADDYLLFSSSAAPVDYWEARQMKLLKIGWEKGVPAREQVILPSHSASITCATEDGDGGVWLGSFTDGLFYWDGVTMARIDEVPGGVRCLVRDREGSVWVGTEGHGVYMVKRMRNTVYTWPADQGPKQVMSLAENSQGILTITALGLRIYRIQGNGQTLVQPPTKENGFPQESRSILADPAGGWWLGRMAAGVYRQGNGDAPWRREDEGIASRRVRCLFHDKSGRLWSGTDDGIAWWTGRRFENALQNQDLRVMCFAEGQDQRLWIGSMSGRLLRLEGSPPRVAEEVAGLPGAKIQVLWMSDENDLWIGTEGAGLFVHRQDGRLGVIRAEHGLPGSSVLSIIEARKGLLALGTQRGIALARNDDLLACAFGGKSHLNVCVVGADEGLDEAACSIGGQPTAVKRRNGTLVFATSVGAIEFDPSEALRSTPHCELSIVSLEVDGDITPLFRDSAEILSTNQSVKLHLHASSLLTRRHLRLRYRVEGLHDDWIHLDGSHTIPLHATHPGRYTLRVQSSHNSLSWDDHGIDFAWVVHPRLWQSAWFPAAAITIIASCLFLIWRRIVHVKLRGKLLWFQHEQSLTNERARIARDMHDTVGARLTQLSLLHDIALADTSLPAGTRETLASAASSTHEVAVAMDEIVWSLNPRHDTLSSLACYLAHVSREYLEPLGIACIEEIACNLDERVVNSKARHSVLNMVKECLQNIAKHASASTVRLRIFTNAGHLYITLTDDGVLAHPTTTPWNDGLRNLGERTAALSGTFTLEPRIGGTEACINLPLIRLA